MAAGQKQGLTTHTEVGPASACDFTIERAQERGQAQNFNASASLLSHAVVRVPNPLGVLPGVVIWFPATMHELVLIDTARANDLLQFYGIPVPPPGGTVEARLLAKVVLIAAEIGVRLP